MMEPNVWKNRLFEIVERLADRDFQARSWLNGEALDSSITSWEEAMCQFFDDADVNSFIEGEMVKAELSPLQQSRFKELRDKLRAFNERFGKDEAYLDPEKILSNVEWDDIIESAKQLLSIEAAPSVAEPQMRPPISRP